MDHDVPAPPRPSPSTGAPLPRPAPDAGPARFRWVPQSWGAFGVLLMLVVAVALPAAFTAAGALISHTGCFIECGTPDHGDAVQFGAATVALLLTPFAAVRFYQGRRSSDERRRVLLVASGAALALAASALATFAL